MANAARDNNRVPTLIGVSSSDGVTPVNVYVDPSTHRLKVDLAAGTGTVTDVSVVSANGFAGTVATSTTTPAITLTTSITGILKGNGTAISAATAGSDYTALAFKTITVSGQSDVVADTASDTLTLVAGTNVTITTDAAADSITINAAAGASGITIGTTTITSGTNTRILYDNSGVVGEYTLTGTGTVVTMQTSPSLLTSLLMDSGFVMNWASSNVVLTHSSGILTLGTGTLKITNPTNTSTSVVTIDGTQTLTNKSISGGQITSAVATATALAATKTIWGQNFDGSGNVTGSLTAVGNITGGASSMTILAGTGVSRTLIFQTTTSGSAATTALTLGADQSATFAGTVALGSNSLTMTGSLAATGARVTKGWFTDLESTNMPTVGGTALLTSLTAPQFTTIELGAASDTTLARVSAGVISVEGVRVITSSGTTSGTILKNNGTTFVPSTETYAAPGTSGNLMTSDGTNWTSAAAGAPSGIGWALVSYTTGTSTTITTSGLDLSTDGHYKIFFECGTTSGANTGQLFSIGINNVTSSTYNYVSSYDSWLSSYTAAGTGGAAVQYVPLSANTFRGNSAEMDFSLVKIDGGNARVMWKWTMMSARQPDDTTDQQVFTKGMAWQTSQTNLTQIDWRIQSQSGTPTLAWKIWVLKLKTS